MNRRKLADRIAAQVVNLGGIGVVLAVAFIAFYLIKEAVPLAADPKRADEPAHVLERPAALIGGSEQFTDAIWQLHADGRLELVRLATQEVTEALEPIELAEDETLARAQLSIDQGEVLFVTDAGRVGVLRLRFDTRFEGEDANAESRRQSFGDVEARWLVDEPQDALPLAADAYLGDAATKADGWAVVSWPDGRLEMIRSRPRSNLLTGEVEWRRKTEQLTLPEPASAVALLDRGGVLAGVGSEIHAFEPGEGFSDIVELGRADAGGRVARMRCLIGRGSAVVATEDGGLSRWLLQPREVDGPVEPFAIHTFEESLPGLRDIAPTARQRVFLAWGDGRALVGQGTSGVILSEFELGEDLAWLTVAPREDFLVIARTGGRIEVVPLELYFPEVTGTALFSKVTYEGLPEPAYTWQSTGGSGQYEPKISLVPLIIGTLKGTIWALLPSIPLAVAGALYCARFLRGRMRETIKPFVELLAGIPSVILGFVGGLYLAPALQDRLLSLFILPLVLAGATVLMGWLWARLPLRRRQQMHEGTAVLMLIPVYALLTWGVIAVGPSIEIMLFGETFSRWAPREFGIPYEQKNAVVVGLAMGFAVTPLIFTLAEDAYRNVPETLADASLALGATPWKTAVRVIEPPARPGVVAATMLGLGRAVGETMIVLMATGGTAITEWNPLQGFRALSANLATELPEAAKGDSLYRTLFLSAVLLFALTFVINTLAEVIRVRGRKDL